MIREKVMSQLLRIYGKLEKMARALQKDKANATDAATNKLIVQEHTAGSSPMINVTTTVPAKSANITSHSSITPFTANDITTI